MTLTALISDQPKMPCRSDLLPLNRIKTAEFGLLSILQGFRWLFGSNRVNLSPLINASEVCGNTNLFCFYAAHTKAVLLYEQA